MKIPREEQARKMFNLAYPSEVLAKRRIGTLFIVGNPCPAYRKLAILLRYVGMESMSEINNIIFLQSVLNLWDRRMDNGRHEIDNLIDDIRLPLYQGKKDEVDHMFIYHLNIMLGGAFSTNVIMSSVIGYENDIHERYFDYIRGAQESKFIRTPMVALLIDPDSADEKIIAQTKRLRSKYDLSDIIIKPKDIEDDIEKVFTKLRSTFHQKKYDLIKERYSDV